MDKAKTYVRFDAGIVTGTNYLTEEVAYFLGGIYAADEHIGGVKRYWAAPVRHNPQYSSAVETAEHFDYVSEISSKVRGYTLMKENLVGTSFDSGKNRLPGFSTIFEETTLNDLNSGIPGLKKALLDSEKPVKRAFILGVFDGRGAPDVNVAKQVLRYISLDCPTNEIGDFLTSVLEDYGFSVNYNTARDRLEGGRPRKPQLRIKDVNMYMKEIGYISPAKYRHVRDVYRAKYTRVTEIDDSAFFNGLKLLKGI